MIFPAKMKRGGSKSPAELDIIAGCKVATSFSSSRPESPNLDEIHVNTFTFFPHSPVTSVSSKLQKRRGSTAMFWVVGDDLLKGRF